MDTTPPARRRRAGILAGLALAASAIGGVAVAAPAVAAAPHINAIDLTSSLVTFKSTTKHTLQVQVHAFVQKNAPANDEADITLTQQNGVGGVSGAEDHSWMFPIQASDLTTNAADGGTLTLSSPEISPFGSLRLTFMRSGKSSTQKCSGVAAATVTPVAISGKFFFKTLSGGTHAWGAVGSQKPNVSVLFTGKSILTQLLPGGGTCLANQSDNNSLPCGSALMWDSSDATTDISGFEFPGLDMMSGSRVVSLANGPRGSMREDDLIAPVPTPKLSGLLDPVTSLLDGVSLLTSGPSSAGGSATVSDAVAGSHTTLSCGTAGKTEKAAAWNGAAYTNGTTPLSLQPQIFGALHVPNNDTAMLLELGSAATTPVPTTSPTTTAADIAKLGKPRW